MLYVFEGQPLKKIHISELGLNVAAWIVSGAFLRFRIHLVLK